MKRHTCMWGVCEHVALSTHSCSDGRTRCSACRAPCHWVQCLPTASTRQQCHGPHLQRAPVCTKRRQVQLLAIDGAAEPWSPVLAQVCLHVRQAKGKPWLGRAGAAAPGIGRARPPTVASQRPAINMVTWLQSLTALKPGALLSSRPCSPAPPPGCAGRRWPCARSPPASPPAECGGCHLQQGPAAAASTARR